MLRVFVFTPVYVCMYIRVLGGLAEGATGIIKLRRTLSYFNGFSTIETRG